MRKLLPLALAFGLVVFGAAQAPVRPPPADPKDFSGLWVISNRSPKGYLDETGAALKGEFLTDKARGLKAKNTPQKDPSAQCLPAMPRHLSGPYPIHFTQSPMMLTQLFEYETTFRIIYLDGRARPDPEDTRWMGFALGKWEGNTLVVETTNLKDEAWLQADGTPTSYKTRLTERYNRVEDGRTLEVSLKIEDPDLFTRPVFRKYVYNYKPEWEIREYYCAEGNRDDPLNQKEGQPGSLGGE